MKLITCLLVGLMLLSGCGGKLHVTVDKALAFEGQVTAEVANLKAVADAAIPLLPVDKQQAAREQLAEGYAKLTVALNAKDQLLQAALEASANDVDITKVVTDIVVAVDSIIDLVQSFGAKQEQMAPIMARAATLKARATVK
jgi:hypothetical protein